MSGDPRTLPGVGVFLHKTDGRRLAVKVVDSPSRSLVIEIDGTAMYVDPDSAAELVSILNRKIGGQS